MRQRWLIRSIVVIGAVCALWNLYQGWRAADRADTVLWAGVLLLSFGWWNLTPDDIVVPWRASAPAVRVGKLVAWAGSALVVGAFLFSRAGA